MSTTAVLLAAVGLLAVLVLTIYMLLGGADYGGGVWDALASGSRAGAQRQAIADAMGPVWEANHVWLIFFVVLLFTAFPRAFWAIVIALFLPLHLVLFGVILRGASFVFRSHGRLGDRVQSAWASTFGAASIVTVFLLGAAVAGVSSSGIHLIGTTVRVDPLRSWLSPFALCTGLLALSLSAYIAAVYLTLETSPPLREDFRRRAIAAGAATTLAALLDLPLMAAYAPHLWARFWHPPVVALPLVASALAALSLVTLVRQSHAVARILSSGAAAVLLWGWAAAEWPYLVYPAFTLQNSAAPAAALRQILVTVPIGLVLLVPSLWLLFRAFKGKSPAVAQRGLRPVR